MPRRAWILMGTLAAVWGASYMLIAIAIDGGLADPFIVFARTLLGALVLAPVALHRGAFPAARRRIGWLALIAGVQIVGPFMLITIGQHHVPSGLAGILVAGAPIFSAIIAAVAVQSERLAPWGVAGILVGIMGIVLLFGVDLSGETATILGGLAILGAALGYSAAAFLAQAKLRDVPPVGIAATVMACSALALLPTVPFAAPAELPTLEVTGAVLALGLGGTGVAFLIFYTLIADIGPSRASIVAYVAPVFSVFFGVTLLDEPFRASTAAGVVLILAGSWLAATGRSPVRRRRAALAPEPAA